MGVKQLSLALAMVLLPAPALASTMPPTAFAAGDRLVAVGLVDASLDVALNDRWAVGVSALANPWANDLALRATCKLDSPWTFTLSAGTSADAATGVHLMDGVPVPTWQAWWLQPALGASVTLLGVRLTGSIGPYVAYNVVTGGFTNLPGPFSLWLLPNVELAYPLARGELTLGGNSFLGWRQKF